MLLLYYSFFLSSQNYFSTTSSILHLVVMVLLHGLFEHISIKSSFFLSTFVFISVVLQFIFLIFVPSVFPRFKWSFVKFELLKYS